VKPTTSVVEDVGGIQAGLAGHGESGLPRHAIYGSVLCPVGLSGQSDGGAAERVTYGRFVSTTTSEGGRSRISTYAELFLCFTGSLSPTGRGPVKPAPAAACAEFAITVRNGAIP
jgi:hypothetical protein